MIKMIRRLIRLKVFRKNDILLLANCCFNEYEKAQSEHKRFCVTLTCDEDQEYTILNERLDENNEILDTKKVLQIIIQFIDYHNERKIYISVANGGREYGNNYYVEGNEEEWVNNVSLKVEELLSSFAPQFEIAKYGKIIFNVFSLSIGYLSLESMFFLLRIFNYKAPIHQDIDLSNPFIYLLHKFLDHSRKSEFIFLMLSYWAVGVWIMWVLWPQLKEDLSKIWPSIEFDFGPNHKRMARRIRKRITLLGTMVLLPLFLHFFFKLF